MWIGAFVVALVGRSFATSPRRWRRPLASMALLVVALIGLVATLFLTLGYLDPNADTTGHSIEEGGDWRVVYLGIVDERHLDNLGDEQGVPNEYPTVLW
jgi:hypothetical protein